MIDDGAAVANDDNDGHGDDGRNDEGDQDGDDSGHREKAPSSRTSESGEINILDDFSEDEQERDRDEDKLMPFAENLEEAVALTMQVNRAPVFLTTSALSPPLYLITDIFQL